MGTPKIVLDTNCLLQILGAKSKFHFLFNEFLAGSYKVGECCKKICFENFKAFG